MCFVKKKISDYSFAYRKNRGFHNSFCKYSGYCWCEFDYPEKEVFQGLAISNLLYNIYFDLLDKTLEKQEIPFVRKDSILIYEIDGYGLPKKMDLRQKGPYRQVFFCKI